ncbi:MAG: biotin-dependent carboxyltransferase family protein [Chloroflexaceae bacterium]|nr:biotin-dependent carboxyltransferase family protein [Chloroflexaceae bacterium]
MNTVARVHDAGMLTTIQDGGRTRALRYGVPQSGAMDRFALAAANLLLGNRPDAAALEITAGGVELELLAPTLFAITGAEVPVTLNGWAVPTWQVGYGGRGMRLALGYRRGDWGARCYLAVAGGIAVPAVLGSASTYLPGAFGGYAGRKLAHGDDLHAYPCQRDPAAYVGRAWDLASRPAYRACPSVRLIVGAHADLFDAATLAHCTSTRYHIGPSSNRMGYRLHSPQALHPSSPASIASLGVLPGVIQVPPDGQPILLMADAQTTGGYPIIGVVITADLPLAAQLLPGDQLQFAFTTHAEAVAARAQLQHWLAQAAHLRPRSAAYAAPV